MMRLLSLCFSCFLLVLAGSLRAQQAPPVAQPAGPTTAADLPGTDWELMLTPAGRADAVGQGRTYALQFLPSGVMMMQGGNEKITGNWSLSSGLLKLDDEEFKAVLGFANGPTTGDARTPAGRFKVTSLRYRGQINLRDPRFRYDVRWSACEFVGRTLQDALENYWGYASYEAPHMLVGQASSHRYDLVSVASIPGKSKNFNGVKAEYLRLLAEMNACVVTIDDHKYGLEALLELQPAADSKISAVSSIFRLKDAPDYMADLRVEVGAQWSSSAWVTLAAGAKSSLVDGKAKGLRSTEHAMLKAGVQWTPGALAPAADPYAGLGIDDLIDRGEDQIAHAEGAEAEEANWRAKSIRYFHAACERGSRLACGRKGSAMVAGSMGLENIERGRPLALTGCSADDGESCYRVGKYMIERWEVSSRDIPGGMQLLQKACDLGYGEACYSVGSHFYGVSKVVPVDHVRALEFYRRGCNLDHANACESAAGLLYLGENGIAKDEKSARALFTQACNHPVARGYSCRLAGAMWSKGEGGAANADFAFVMFRRGCDVRDAKSCAAINQPVPQ